MNQYLTDRLARKKGRSKCPCGSRKRFHSCCGKPKKGKE